MTFSNTKTSNQLPSDIRAVSKKNNLFEEKDIRKAGYTLNKKVKSETKGVGHLTIWTHDLKQGFLMFIEQPDGFYQFGGYMTPE